MEGQKEPKVDKICVWIWFMALVPPVETDLTVRLCVCVRDVSSKRISPEMVNTLPIKQGCHSSAQLQPLLIRARFAS